MSVVEISLTGFSVAAGALSYFLCFRTEKAISLQIRFYTLINWRVEPISMEREIRSTRFMGEFLFVFTVLACAYYVFFVR